MLPRFSTIYLKLLCGRYSAINDKIKYGYLQEVLKIRFVETKFKVIINQNEQTAAVINIVISPETIENTSLINYLQ